ncbi:hypothetical protein PEC301879_04680 [Pectobacterium carotovorum subsp. carotovorum]|nr:hypothetical protein PEC301879_04680 [Pectobacterium carotovorum subsp. carotovorum]
MPISVYPRWRGEHVRHTGHSVHLPGLSPLARGTPLSSSRPVCLVRFIPAGAGNTVVSNQAMLNNAVYPRWRGEHFELGALYEDPIGLSPLARGTRYPLLRLTQNQRFIPAGAGNTYLFFDVRLYHAVYPRWRGEHKLIH